jgi:hypothetical protein
VVRPQPDATTALSPTSSFSSLLALYHLLGGTNARDLPGVDALLAEASVRDVPRVKRVVLVGNKISPGNPAVKADGAVVKTLWGELAYQLGGKRAFDFIRNDDKNAANPGDALRRLFNEHGPALILIDEWVAYARQLHDDTILPAGTFETHFSFAQALTESARLAKNCLLVISLPASDTATASPNAADEVEVGGLRGRQALERLRNVIGRVESNWRPASAEEGFEIVRRRLFKPIGDNALFEARDNAAYAYADLYRHQAPEFPPEACECDTDLHAFAVLLYEWPARRQPLRGPKIHDALSVVEDEKRSFGDGALFIESPTDSSNRPARFQPLLARLAPPLVELFTRAFVSGLHHPEARPAAQEWAETCSAAIDAASLR